MLGQKIQKKKFLKKHYTSKTKFNLKICKKQLMAL